MKEPEAILPVSEITSVPNVANNGENKTILFAPFGRN